MKHLLFPLAAVLVAGSAFANQNPVQSFPMQVQSRDASLQEVTLTPALDQMRALTALDQVVLTGVPLPSGETVDVELDRIDISKLRFGFFVDGKARPDLLDNLDLSLWKGQIVGDPASEVHLSFSNSGSRGWINRPGDVVHFMPRPGADGDWHDSKVLVTSDANLAARGRGLGQYCETEQYIDGYEQAFNPERVTTNGLAAPEGANGCNIFECTIAVETDYQLFQIFNDLTAETAYITTLLGYISARYEEQINTILTYPYVQFYSNPGDPWNTPDTGGSSGDMLDEFVNAWSGNIPMDASLGHFVSGAGLGGGIAYLNVLGNDEFGFGVSGNINSNVNFPVMQQPDNWDFIVIAHELGHNFSAPHTHSVCPPIDECPSSQYWGPCQDETICLNDGTVMSYCHLCPGGTGNITTYFHPENVARMQSAASLALPPFYAAIAGEKLVTVSENSTTPVSAQITGSSPISQVLLNYRFGGAGSYQAVPMTHQGGGQYTGQFPAANCDSSVEYYYSFSSPDCGLGTDPKNAPSEVYGAEVGTLVTLFGDDFEANNGWTANNLGASTGDWQRGVPVDDPGWAYDPASDFDGSGQCYMTQNELGNTDVDDGAVELVSPVLDSSAGNMAVSYAYYLVLTNDDGTDALVVEWSSNGNGGPWTEIARHDNNVGGWALNLITPDDLASAGVNYSANTRIRFTANDTGDGSIVEAAIDAFELAELECQDGGAVQYCVTSPNSAGSGAVISSLGSVSISSNNFLLVSGNAIPNGPGLFYYGPTMIQAPFGDGFRCVGGATRRLNPVTTADGMGTTLRTLDFTVPPASSGPHMIVPGSTWNFQHWFRDAMAGMSGFNLSNGLSVTFLP